MSDSKYHILEPDEIIRDGMEYNVPEWNMDHWGTISGHGGKALWQLRESYPSINIRREKTQDEIIAEENAKIEESKAILTISKGKWSLA